MSESVYTPNSHKYKEEQKQKQLTTEDKQIKKVVKSPAKTKTNEVRKIADIFISEDISNVKNYIFMDVIVPAVKKAIYDVVTNGIDMFLYGGTGKGKTNSNGGKVSYRSYYERKDNSGYRGSENVKSVNSFDYEEIVFDNRGEAEAAKQQMMDIIKRYGMVTVADLYDMADRTAPYTSQKYGWMDVSGAETQRVRDGYILKLPKAVPID
jgi:hypothetical protein